MRVLFCLIIFLCGTAIYAQSPQRENISNVQVRYRTTGEEHLPPPSVFDPAYQDRKVEMEISFTVTDLDSTATIEIKTGKTAGTADILQATVTCFKTGNKNFFMYKERTYEIKNNQVVFTELVPESTLKKSSFLSVTTSDRKNNRSKSFTKKLN